MNNQLRSRADFVRAAMDLIGPVIARLTEGNAGLRLGESGAVYPESVADMEGFSRILWAVVPMLAARDPEIEPVWALWREGIVNGTNPEHPAYWGDIDPFDQRMVEMAAPAMGLCFARRRFGDALSDAQKLNLHAWLGQINRHDMPENNWRFFRVLVNSAFRLNNMSYSSERLGEDFARIEAHYESDGWYFDYEHQREYYTQLREHDRMNHDVGFLFLPSFGADLRIGGGGVAAEKVLLNAADLLAGRFNPNGFIRAWNGAGREGWAIVDSLMNLPLLWWASARTGDPRYRLIAGIHADTSIRYFLRGDGSCNHIVAFDPDTGAFLDAPGGQGYAPGSSWSRGQAWALYGFALAYRHSGATRYLDAACKAADYFVSHIRPDGLTDCDFRQPEAPERIDNIAGAVAACGLTLLSRQAKEPRYLSAAETLLRALDALCADWREDACGILTRCTAAYHDDGAGRDVNLVYGDYFFVEAINRLRGVDLKLWEPDASER